MPALRRLYLYAVSFVSLEVVLWGAIGLARSFAAGGGEPGDGNQLAQALSLLLVGVPVFLLHWGLAQRGVRGSPGERSALLRAVFLYGTLAATLVPVVNNVLALLDRLLAQGFGLPPSLAPLGGMQTLSDNLIAIVLNGLAGAYFYLVPLRLDWASGQLGEDFTVVRRLYRYLWAVYALVMAGVGLQRLLEYALLRLAAASAAELSLFSSGLALLLVGAPLWAFTMRVVIGSLVEPGESESRLRLAVILTLVFIAAAGGLVCVVAVFQELTELLLGSRPGPDSLFTALSIPLSAGVVFAAVWAFHRRLLFAEMQRIELNDDRRAASLRRLHGYVMSLYGLLASFIGLQMLCLALIDLALDQGMPWGPDLRNLLAGGIATTLVGLPVWILCWRPLMVESAIDGEAGDAARRSLVRRGYLYLALFAGVMGVMFVSGGLIFQLLSALLGEPEETMLLSALQLLCTLVLFALLLAYHAWMLRGDNRRIERLLSRRRSQYPLLVLAPDDPEFANHLVAALEREAPGLPVALHPIEQGAPDEILSAAKAVVLPGELLAKPPEALRLWLQGFSGPRLILPTPLEGWVWISTGNPSLHVQARRLARLVRRLAEGEN